MIDNDDEDNFITQALEEKRGESQFLQKELKQINKKIEKLNSELDTKNQKIQELQKQIQNSKPSQTQRNKNNQFKDSNMITLRKQIHNIFCQIQHQCHSSQFDKYKEEHIEYLLNKERELNIYYIIIQKLDISEEFLAQHNIVDTNNLYENLKALSKIGKLKYSALKSCGPMLFYRLSEHSTFEQLKEKSYAIWGIQNKTLSLYDDTFNNMEMIKDTSIQEYFSYYQPTDPSLPKGYVVLYLLDKLNNQKSLLNIQERAINKMDYMDEFANSGNKYGNDLDNCVEKLKNGEVLKGINKYRYKPRDKKKEFEKVLALPENGPICILIAIILICVSFYAVQEKNHNIKKWSQIFKYNEAYLSSTGILNLNEEGKDEFKEIFDNINSYIKDNSNNEEPLLPIQIFGPIQHRFFCTEQRPEKDNESPVFNLFKYNKPTLYYMDYNSDDHKDTSISLGTYTYKSEKETNIEHIYNTHYGKIDKSGIQVITTFKDFKENYDSVLGNVVQEAENIQGFELLYNIYEPNLDIFVANAFLIQRSIIGKFHVTVADTIPFVTNVYENKTVLFAFDIIRIILTVIMLLTIPLYIYLKYKSLPSKSAKKLITIIITTLFQMKNILLIISTIFLIQAIAYFNSKQFDTQKLGDETKEFVDLYSYADNQRKGRYFDQIAFYLFFIYALKYLQYFSSVNVFLKSFKKSAFEFTVICVIILLFILGMSVSTHYVYGSYIKEYSTFYYSVISNIKILLFVEDTMLITRLNEYFKEFSICLLIFYILFVRFLFLNLFHPVMIEYLRIETDRDPDMEKDTTKNDTSQKKNNNKDHFGWKESKLICYITHYIYIELKMFLCSVKKAKDNVVPSKKPKAHDVNIDTILGRQ